MTAYELLVGVESGCGNICIAGGGKFHLHDHDTQQLDAREFQASLL